MHQNPFRPHNPSEPKYGDKKKMGICGAPQCHCTPLLLALCIALSGLVMVGVGSCIVGFMGNDDAPKALGASLIAIGMLMMIVGAAFFVYDTFLRVRFPIGQSVGYAYQPHESTQFDQPSTSYGAAAPVAATDNYRAPKGHENVAPPAYDSVLEQKSESRHQAAHGARAKPPLVV